MFFCGKELNIGDYVKVEYTTGKEMKGSRIWGKITKLWPSHPYQAQLESGWCFHENDKIIEHKPSE